jgi:predicted class III extradiol MEMO1 family dioxygenase
MRTEKYIIKLAEDDRKALRRMLKSATHTARGIIRTNILLKLDESLGEKREWAEVARYADSVR